MMMNNHQYNQEEGKTLQVVDNQPINHIQISKNQGKFNKAIINLNLNN